MFSDINFIIILTICIAVGIAIFILLREFWCWYFKINEIRDLMKNEVEILVSLKTAILERIPDQAKKDMEKLDHKLNQKAINIDLGKSGEAGGVVFFDKGNYSDGWRYIEASPEDILPLISWKANEYKETLAKDRKLGGGKNNTIAIIAKNGEGLYAANMCRKYSLGGYSDWCLPSLEEMKKLGEFYSKKSQPLNSKYWTSTESNESYAYYYALANTKDETDDKMIKYCIRAIRYF